MNTPTTFTLAVVALLCPGVSSSAANDRPGSQCIELSPALAGFKLARTDTSGVAPTSQEPLAEMSAYLVAYVERPDDPISGHPTIAFDAQGVFIFKTTGGRFLVRITDIPPDHGWYGPF